MGNWSLPEDGQCWLKLVTEEFNLLTHGQVDDELVLGVVNHSCGLLQSKQYVSGLICGQAGEGSCAKGLDNVTKLLQRFGREMFVLGQCVRNGCI